jgi:sulfite exporter TauE/SafE
MVLGALIAGAVGSGHCLAMCGGIAGALGLSSRAAAERAGRPFAFPVLYNLGRVASYTIAGAAIGGLGSGLTWIAALGELRIALQVVAGALLAAIGLTLALKGRGWSWLERAGLSVWRRIAPLLRPILPVDTPARAFAAGMVWGWLPCAMAYGMLMLAWFSASARDGALIMVAFGAGTLPAMVLSAGAAQRAGAILAGSRLRVAGGTAMAAMGLLLVVVPLMHAHPALAQLPGVAACASWLGVG